MREFLGLLVIVGFIGAYFWQIVVALAVIGLAWVLWRKWPEWAAARKSAERAHQSEQLAIAERADRQHAWVLAGDPRGTYGEPLGQ